VGGTFSARVIASYFELPHHRCPTRLGADQLFGRIGSTGAFGGFNTSPNWQANAFLTYPDSPFSGTVQLRYVGPGKFLTFERW